MTAPAEYRTVRTLRLSATLDAELIALAARDRRSVNAEIEHAIARMVAVAALEARHYA
jgi:hypothetical protein